MTERTTLVLMPGIDGTGKLFDPVIPYLTPHFDLKVVTYPDLNSFNDYVDYAQRQLPDKPGYSILAESFSGPVAMVLMSRFQDQVGPSVLCSTFCRSPLQTLTQMTNLVPDQIFSLGALNAFCLDVEDLTDTDFSDTQPIPLNVTAHMDGKVLKNWISVMSRVDVSAMLPEIRTPVLFLQGTRDKIVSDNYADMVESGLPDVKRMNFEAPHLLLQTQPQLCVEFITRHIYKNRD